MLNLKNDKCTATGLLVLRVGIGCLMLVHGWAKLNGFDDLADKFPNPIGIGSKLSLILAIGAEVGCSLLLIFGFATRIASIPLAFTMIVALFVVHAEDPWKMKEMAAVYLLVYVSLMMTGPGSFSIDHCVFGRKKADVSATEEQS